MIQASPRHPPEVELRMVLTQLRKIHRLCPRYDCIRSRYYIIRKHAVVLCPALLLSVLT